MKCECGSTEFHCYFHHVSKGIERFRCLKCNNRYELQAESIMKLDSPALSLDEQAWQNFRAKINII
ncbi:hypothetical protein [Metasolibacillus meyeri]|uniref:hypothetical protein n=1 Tax=Metasolibacillus meyeri TaxID=1071052 RepID=UPI000D326842|nr:hypothetical protein [Metasolibacillus meyeri]